MLPGLGPCSLHNLGHTSWVGSVNYCVQILRNISERKVRIWMIYRSWPARHVKTLNAQLEQSLGLACYGKLRDATVILRVHLRYSEAFSGAPNIFWGFFLCTYLFLRLFPVHLHFSEAFSGAPNIFWSFFLCAYFFLRLFPVHLKFSEAFPRAPNIFWGIFRSS